MISNDQLARVIKDYHNTIQSVMNYRKLIRNGYSIRITPRRIKIPPIPNLNPENEDDPITN